MGTRSLICVFYKGRFVIAQYSQWDGYPEGQGATILKFLQDAANIERLKEGLEFIIILDEEDVRQIFHAQQDSFANGSKPSQFLSATEKLSDSLSRDTGAKILEIITQARADKRVPIFNELEFVNDGLFCEWAYVVDLDKRVFEVFGGSARKNMSGSDRFADVGTENDSVPGFIKAFSFDEIPTSDEDFFHQLNEATEDQNDEEDEAEDEGD